MKKIIILFMFILCFLSVQVLAYELKLPQKSILLTQNDDDEESWESEFDKAKTVTPAKKQAPKEAKETNEAKPKTLKNKEQEKVTDDLEEKIYETDSKLFVREKSIYLAVMFSFIVGFGLGNFYAEEPFPGYIFFFMELIGVGLIGGGIAMLLTEDSYNFLDATVSPGEGFIYGGLLIFAGTRIYSTINAAFAAHNYNKSNRIKTFGVVPYYKRYKDTNYIGLTFNL